MSKDNGIKLDQEGLCNFKYEKHKTSPMGNFKRENKSKRSVS